MGFSWWNQRWENDNDPSHDTTMRVQDIPVLAGTFDTKLGAAGTLLQLDPVLVTAPPLPSPPIPLDTCPSTPLPDCKAPAKSQLFMKTGGDGSGNRLKFDFKRGSTPQVWDDLADPTVQTSYLLCLYVGESLATSAEVPPGSVTWRARPRGKGYQYRYRDGNAAGVIRVTLDAGGRGTPEPPNVKIRGKGTNLPDLPLPVPTPIDLAVQVVNAANHNSWGDIYASAIVNGGGQTRVFRARNQ